MTSRVIKRSQTEPPHERSSQVGTAPRRPPVIGRETFQARSEAQSIREQAEAEAATLLQSAREEAEKICAQAHDEGYQKGHAEGAAELTEVIAQTVARMRTIEEQVEPQLRELALKIAKKILGRELEHKPETVVDIVRQALSEKARQRREIFLRVNPEDAAMMREHRPALAEVLVRCKEIGLREDPDVARYGTIIETDAGTIDAQLETQLAVFERILLGVE